MKTIIVLSMIAALSLTASTAWSQEVENGTPTSPPAQAASQSSQDIAPDPPRKQKGMKHGHHCMGGHGMKHRGKGAGKGHEMRHGHHQEVLDRLDRIEKRQILIETMLRELLLDQSR